MTLEPTARELSPALGIGAFAEKTLVAAGQCTKVDPAAPPEVGGPARLRRDGRHRRRDQHRRRRPRRLASPSSAAAASATRPSPAPGWPARRRSSPSTSTTGSSTGPRSSAPPTRSTPASTTPVEAIQATHRRQRRGRRHRRGRPPGDLQAGLLRPRPGRHRRAGRRAHPGDDASSCRCSTSSAAAAPLKSSWYGDCLPSRDFPMLIDLYLQGRLAAGRSSSPRPSALDDVEEAFDQDAPRRGPALGGGPVMSRDRPGRHLGHVLAGRRHLGRRQQRLARRRRRTRSSSSTPRTTPTRSRPRSAGGASWRSSAPTRTTTTSTRRPRWPSGSARRSCCTRPTGRCGTWPTRTASPTASWPTARCSPWAGSSCTCCTRPATPRARSACTPRSSARCSRGDTLFQGGPGATGRSFSSFDTIIDSIRERLLTLPGDTAVHTGHGDSTRSARRPAPGGVDRQRALNVRRGSAHSVWSASRSCVAAHIGKPYQMS